MEKGIHFTLLNILKITVCSGIILVILGILKWYLGFKKRTRGMFYKIRNYRTPSYLPVVGHAFKFVGTPTQIHNNIMRVAFKYGPNFAIWFVDKVILIVGTPEDAEKVLHSQHCLEKHELYRFTWDVVGFGLFSAPVKIWRRNRKIINPTFHGSILEGYLPIMGDAATILTDEILPEHVDKKGVDWYTIFTAANLQVITKTAMGVDMADQRKSIPFGEWLELSMRAVFIRMLQILYYPDVIFYRTKLGKQFLRCRINLFKFTEKIISDRRQKFKEDLENGKYQSAFDECSNKMTVKKAFLDYLLELDHRGMKFTDKELRDEINTFMVGGTDTTSITACFFLTMMGMHPDIQEQVYKEVMSVLGPERLPTVQDLNEMQFTERCIKETMRIFTPAPVIMRQNTGPDLQLSDGVLPEGAACVVCIDYLHRSARYWKDPLKFNPDRFLPEEVLKRHPYTYLPFSAGLRGCIGQKFATMNIKTLLSSIIRKYKIHCDAYNSIEDIKLKNVMVLRPINGFKFSMEKRKTCSFMKDDSVKL